MKSAEAVLAAVIAGAAVVLVVGAGVLYFGSTVNPVHTDPAAIPSAAVEAGAGLVVLLASALASYIPARRAVAIEPASSLKLE